MRVNVYYTDLAIFKCLTDVLNYPAYKVVEYCKNFMVVEWKEASLGVGGTRVKNTEYMNPYRQAERLAAGKPIIFC